MIPDSIKQVFLVGPEMQVSFQTGMSMLSRTTQAAGSRLLSQNVVGPYRPSPKRQAPPTVLEGEQPRQAAWNGPARPTLAHRMFLQ